MPLRNYWAENAPTFAREDLTPNADSGTHVIQFHAYVPDAAHVKKLVCSGGISIRGSVFADITNLGLPMSWFSEIYMLEGSSDAWPSGRIVYLNKQAGELVTTQVSQTKQIAAFSGSSQAVNNRVNTWYSGHIEPINQGMSYGSIDQSIGTRDFGVNFYVKGVHGQAGGSAPPWYSYTASFVIRVLYELEVAGGGGGG